MSLFDIRFTSETSSFQKTSTVTTGISDCHKWIVACLKTDFKILPLK